MDLSKIVKKSIGGKDYYTDDTKYYTEYKLQPGDTGLMQIARDVLKAQNLYTEILWLDHGVATEIKNKNDIKKEWTVLLPAAAPVGSTAAAASDLLNLTITASYGVNVRTGHGVNFEVLILGTNTKNKPFEYRKSSVIADGSYVWAEVTLNPPTKDKAGKVYNKGWICVKEGSTYYTTPNIDKL